MTPPNSAALSGFKLFSVFSAGDMARLTALAQSRRLKAGETVFEENDSGDQIYFILSGAVRIEKRLDHADVRFKTLALLGAGEFFGEMAAMDPETSAARSARAMVSADCELAAISGKALLDFIGGRPAEGIAFMRAMLAAMSRRLRKTSGELAMVYDISALAFLDFDGEREFAARLLNEAMLHFDGGWSAGFYYYNQFNDELELAAVEGAGFSEPKALAGIRANSENLWQDDRTYIICLPGEKRPAGFIVFISKTPVPPEEKSALSVSLSTLGFLSGSIMSNIGHVREDKLRERLSHNRYQS